MEFDGPECKRPWGQQLTRHGILPEERSTSRHGSGVVNILDVVHPGVDNLACRRVVPVQQLDFVRANNGLVGTHLVPVFLHDRARCAVTITKGTANRAFRYRQS